MPRWKCGCYDGPYSEDMPKMLVSVRCEEHADVPPLRDHSFMVVNKDGKIIESKPRGKLDGHQSLRLKQAKQVKKYSGAKKVDK